jgi:hypothetical protein
LTPPNNEMNLAKSAMPDAPEQRLLEALLDSWDRSNTILLNLLRSLPEGGLEARAMEGSPSVAELFTHIHFVPLVFVFEDAPESKPGRSPGASGCARSERSGRQGDCAWRPPPESPDAHRVRCRRPRVWRGCDGRDAKAVAVVQRELAVLEPPVGLAPTDQRVGLGEMYAEGSQTYCVSDEKAGQGALDSMLRNAQWEPVSTATTAEATLWRYRKGRRLGSLSLETQQRQCGRRFRVGVFEPL